MIQFSTILINKRILFSFSWLIFEKYILKIKICGSIKKADLTKPQLQNDCIVWSDSEFKAVRSPVKAKDQDGIINCILQKIVEQQTPVQYVL